MGPAEVKKDDERFMGMAVEEAYAGIEAGDGGPFGAIIVKDGRVIATAHNTVLADNDPTQHAEIKAISAAAGSLGTYDLSGSSVYSTNEPCPMCFSAIHWARIGRLIYGTGIEDIRKLGFNELTIPAERMKNEGASPVDISGGFMRPECEKLLDFWNKMPDKKVY